MRALLALSALVLSSPVMARGKAEEPDQKAARLEAQMTDAERIGLLSAIMPIPLAGVVVGIPDGAPATAR